MQNLMFRLGETPGAIRWPGRRLGQDNPEVFAELGVDEQELLDLRAKGVV
jgi:crotonobetainyl-CoA:carnitine CoA-transferase CaiB-like acyl-CoA transferase